MRFALTCLALCSVFAGSVSAQYEVNKAGATLTVDGLATDGTFAATTLHGTTSSANIAFSTTATGFVYDFAYNSAGLVTPGTPLAGQTVNLDLAQGFTFLSGGAGFPIFGGGLGATSYAVNLTVTVPAAAGDLSIQAYAIDPTAPAGLALSQASHMSIFADNNIANSSLTPNPAAAPVTLGDDSSSVQTLAVPFTFYGVTYTDCHIGSNGYVTFGTGETDLSESVADFLGNAPRISALWDDLNPSSAGTVTFYSDPTSGITEVAFQGVPEYATSNSNNFIVLFDPAQVVLDWSSIASMDNLVGLSPGGNLAAGQAMNLSGASGAAVTPGEAPYELFDGSNPFDLNGKQLTFILDTFGQPIIAL